MSGVFSRFIEAAKVLARKPSDRAASDSDTKGAMSEVSESKAEIFTAVKEQTAESQVPADAERVSDMSNNSISTEVLQSAAAEALSRIGAIQRYLVANRSGFRSVLGYESAEKLMNDMHGAVYTLAYYGKKVTRGFYNSLEYVAKENFEHLPPQLQLLRLQCLNIGMDSVLDVDSDVPVDTRYKNLRAAFAMFHKPENATVDEREKVYA